MLKNVYTANLTAEQIGSVVLEIMRSDARVASLICAQVVPVILPNYRFNQESKMLEDIYGNKVLVRAFTDNGCSFIPSFMRGSGRGFDEGKFQEYYSLEAEVVLVVDVRNLPQIQIVEILGCDIADGIVKKIPAWYGDELFTAGSEYSLVFQ